MKHLQILLIALLIAPVVLMAQYPQTNGISTNPANPINPELPSKANDFFNWQLQSWAIQPNVCLNTSAVESPFFRIDNLEELREAKDMRWEDGWELIRRGVGLNENNQYTIDKDEHIYVVLYNRYTGILRVLLRVCREQDYQLARIHLDFGGQTNFKTDLLELSRGLTALDKLYTPTSFTSTTTYFNDNSKWFYADFPMMYDPCTPLYESKLGVITKMVHEANISLTGTLSGEILAQDAKPGTTNNGSTSWKDKAQSVNGKFSKVFGSVGKFRKEAETQIKNLKKLDEAPKLAGLTKLTEQLQKSWFLRSGTLASLGADVALGIFDVFSGGGKKSSTTTTVKITPMSISMSAQLNGTMKYEGNYHNIQFTNPGSKNAKNDPDVYPYYNEVMGIFNLLGTPRVYWERAEEKLNDTYVYPWLNSNDDVYVNRFKIDKSTFKYVLNPAAGLKIKEMQMALVVEGKYEATYDYNQHPDEVKMSEFVYEGKDEARYKHRFRTKYKSAKCFLDYTFKTVGVRNAYSPSSNNYSGMWTNWQPEMGAGNKTYLKIMLNLQREDADSNPFTQNILYVVTYPVKIVPTGMMKYWQLSNKYADCPTTPVFYDIPEPASVWEVNNFCNSQVYQANRDVARERGSNEDLVTRNTDDIVSIYPNPNNGIFTIKLHESLGQVQQIMITDMLGKNIEIPINSLDDSNRQIQIQQGLRQGTYIITIRGEEQIVRKKILVNK